MKESTRKIIMWVSLAVGVIVSVLSILFALDQKKFGWAFDTAFWVILCYIAGSLCAMLLWWILSIIKKPKSFLIVFACVVVVLGASILFAGTDKPMSSTLLNKYGNTAGEAKLIAIACYSTYILAIAACVLLVYAEIAKAFKKK